jgi:hypothetical protein
MALYDPALFVNGRYQAAPTTPAAGRAPYPGNPETFSYDPNAVGGGVAQYYNLALAGQPTFEPIMRNISGIPNPMVAAEVAQQAAERGVGIGSYGGPNDATAYLRALGLTGQALQDIGIEQYRQAYATVPQLSPTSLFISPTDLSQMNLQWNLNEADIVAAMARQRAADEAAMARARLAASTQTTLQRENISAQNYWASVNRSDTQAYLNRIRGDVGGISGMYNQMYGGGVSAPGVAENPLIARGTATEPIYWPDFGEGVYTGGGGVGGAVVPESAPATYGSAGSAVGYEYPPTGGIYMGPSLGSPEAEYNALLE